MYTKQMVEKARALGYPGATRYMLSHAMRLGIVSTPPREIANEKYYVFEDSHLGQFLQYLAKPRCLGRPRGSKNRPKIELQEASA